MPDPGQASPYALEASKYENLSNMFSGIAGNKSDRLRNKLTKEQIRNARLLGDKRAIDLEEAQWRWHNVAKTKEDVTKLLEGLSGGGAEAEAAFILGTTPEMVQKWKGLQSGLNDIHRRTTIINDEKRKADRAYRDGQIDQAQYENIKARTKTELEQAKKEGFAAKVKENEYAKQILGKKAKDRLTGEDARQSQLEKQQTLESYSQATGPEPDIPPALQGLIHGSDEWKEAFQQWIINANPSKAQIEAVASGGSIADSVTKKTQPKRSAYTPYGSTAKKERETLSSTINNIIQEKISSGDKAEVTGPGHFDTRSIDAEEKDIILNNVLRYAEFLIKNGHAPEDIKVAIDLIMNKIGLPAISSGQAKDGKWHYEDFKPMTFEEIGIKFGIPVTQSKRAQAQQRYNELEAAGLEPKAIEARLKSEGLL